jgi:hypothetical protein
MSYLANTTGVVGLIGLAAITMFYMLGGPFGTLNDACNALMGLLSAALAWRLRPWHPSAAPRLGGLTLACALTGAVVALLGSVLVMFRFTGWYLAGLVTSLGYAFTGVWLVSVSEAALRSRTWPRGVAQWGRVTGALMALGFLAIPGILARTDSAPTAPWWAHAGFAGGLGWVLFFPIWCLGLARAAKQRSSIGRREAKLVGTTAMEP